MEVNNMGIQTVWKKCNINFEIISAETVINSV